MDEEWNSGDGPSAIHKYNQRERRAYLPTDSYMADIRQVVIDEVIDNEELEFDLASRVLVSAPLPWVNERC